MILQSVSELKVWHCHNDTNNKVWGYFCHGTSWWAFWGGVHKAWSFKHHGEETPWLRGDLAQLSLKKQAKGYKPLSVEQLSLLDLTWQDRFNERFVYFLLQQPSI